MPTSYDVMNKMEEIEGYIRQAQSKLEQQSVEYAKNLYLGVDTAKTEQSTIEDLTIDQKLEKLQKSVDDLSYKIALIFADYVIIHGKFVRRGILGI